jgi:DNA modification methylase
VRCEVHHGDCLDVLQTLAAESVDACVTDPPYHLTSIVKRFGADNAAPAKSNGATGVYARSSAGFMGKAWDGGDIAFRPDVWREAFRVIKPGAHLVAFGGTRTYHRLVCAIEDAGFEVRDQIGWCYGSGFPKSLDIGKAIDKAAGAERDKVKPRSVIGHQRNIGNRRPYMDDPDHLTDSDTPATDAARQWNGWGTALKPAWEPIVLARKPLSESTVAGNVLRHGTGGLNIAATRVAAPEGLTSGGACIGNSALHMNRDAGIAEGRGRSAPHAAGRWPANLVHDGSPEVLEAFAAFGQLQAGNFPARRANIGFKADAKGTSGGYRPMDSGTAARFFYSAKASKADRAGSKHPTVKPVALMRWLVRMITPPGGVVLDPFAGSGTTGAAAVAEGFRCILIEREKEYFEDIQRRLATKSVPAEPRAPATPHDYGPLFATVAGPSAG